MSYEKQTWEDGQVITADKLNHMENGIAKHVPLDVVFSGLTSDSSAACTHTLSQIATLLAQGYRLAFWWELGQGWTRYRLSEVLNYSDDTLVDVSGYFSVYLPEAPSSSLFISTNITSSQVTIEIGHV